MEIVAVTDPWNRGLKDSKPASLSFRAISVAVTDPWNRGLKDLVKYLKANNENSCSDRPLE